MNAENQKEITTWRGLAGPFERLLGAQVRRWADDRSASEADAEAAASLGLAQIPEEITVTGARP